MAVTIICSYASFHLLAFVRIDVLYVKTGKLARGYVSCLSLTDRHNRSTDAPGTTTSSREADDDDDDSSPSEMSTLAGGSGRQGLVQRYVPGLLVVSSG
jgi:hypothetical protein